MQNKSNKKEPIITTKIAGPKFDVIGTAQSREIFKQNPGLMKKLLEASKEIGIITSKGIIKSYKDPQNRFSLELIARNKIFTLGDKATKANYELSIGNKKFTVMIRTMDKVFNQTALDVILKSEILKKAGINVIEPIKGISNRPENKTIIIYPDYSSLKGARDVLSFKQRDALKANIEKLNLRLNQTIKDHHKEINLDPNSRLKLSIDDFRVDPKTKKIFAIFEY